MPLLFAQPYDFDAYGFYFSSATEYFEKYQKNLPVEEYEFQFIDGTDFESFVFENHVSGMRSLEGYFKIIEKFKDSIKDENLVALEYLFETENIEIEKALEKIDDVVIFEGTAESYAMEFCCDHIREQLGKLEFYFDYELLSRDMILNSEIYEYKKDGIDYIISHC
jgi:hypothetical protein